MVGIIRQAYIQRRSSVDNCGAATVSQTLALKTLFRIAENGHCNI